MGQETAGRCYHVLAIIARPRGTRCCWRCHIVFKWQGSFSCRHSPCRCSGLSPKPICAAQEVTSHPQIMSPSLYLVINIWPVMFE